MIALDILLPEGHTGMERGTGSMAFVGIKTEGKDYLGTSSTGFCERLCSL